MNWKFAKKVEDMTPAELKIRIEEGYNTKLSDITPVPYVGQTGELVTYDYPELVALCPMTGILDTYRVIIDFIPKDFIPELKSLKMYFLDYKDLPISHEHICSKIKKEFEKNIQPEKICVRLFTSVRGGIYTTIKLGDDSIASSIKQRKVFG